MILRIVCILISVVIAIAVFVLSNDKVSSDTQPLILDISGDIEPYGDLHLCDDFIYRVGKIPLKLDDVWDRNQTRFGTYYVLGDGETSNSQRWRSVEGLPMRWEPLLNEYLNNYPLDAENHILGTVEQIPIVST